MRPVRSSEESAAGWRACLDLEYVAQAGLPRDSLDSRPHGRLSGLPRDSLDSHPHGRLSGRTKLVRRTHQGPLVVQRPFYPEGDVCHTYVVHPPGGIVGGDQLELVAKASRGAHVLLTTPAATKFYRSSGRQAYVTQRVSAEDAVVEWLPQENIYYPDAQVRASTELHLTTRSRILAWEVGCLGLPASGFEFASGSLRLALELWVEGEPRFIDRLRVCGSDDALGAAWGWAGYEVFGTMLAYPAGDDDLEAARGIEIADGELATTLVDGVLVARCLARRAAAARAAFASMWAVLRPRMLGRTPCAPRIWAT